MSLVKYSVETFKQILKERTQEIAKENNWDWNGEVPRGYSFQLWIAEVISNYENEFEIEPKDALLYSKDLKADLVLEDPVNKKLLICQCKFVSLAKLPPVNEDEFISFFERHYLFMDRTWIEKHGSADAIERLADYREKVDDGYSVEYRFITTGRASDRHKEVTVTINQKYAQKGLPIICELVDFYSLKDYFGRAESIEESIPAEVRIQLPVDRYFLVERPYRTVTAALKGNALRDLYRQHKESMFAYNIRSYLGNRGINTDIKNTADKEPEKFYYFNNGISAICTGFDVEGNELIAYNFQVINGAQTVGTLARSEPDQNIYVLFRLTEAKTVKTEKGFNEEIIRYNNTQNVIKVSDFRSNDQIQHWLERRFTEQKQTPNLPNLRYVRKRSYKRVVGQVALKLEELAKIRYAFDWEPTRVLQAPRDLWTLDEDGGVYSKAFGIDGQLETSWPDDVFYKCLLAICFYSRFNFEAKNLAKKASQWRFLHRLRWHALSLAGCYIRNRCISDDAKHLVTSEKEFTQIWSEYWNIVPHALDDVYSQAMDEKVTIYSLTRSAERWNKMKARLEKRATFLEFGFSSR